MLSFFFFFFGRICPIVMRQSLNVLCSGVTQSLGLCSLLIVNDSNLFQSMETVVKCVEVSLRMFQLVV